MQQEIKLSSIVPKKIEGIQASKVQELRIQKNIKSINYQYQTEYCFFYLHDVEKLLWVEN